MKLELEFHPVSQLPVIPENRYGVSVLVIQYDKVIDHYYMTDAMYSYTTDKHGKKLPWFEDCPVENTFMQMYSGPDGSEWGPTGDPVLYWAYIPRSFEVKEVVRRFRTE